MRGLVRRSLRGRWGQVLALAITMAFSAMLVGALGLLTETGVRGQVSTGEYDAAPVLIGANQTRPVRDDVDLSIPGRALLPASVVDEVSEELPDARVVADRILPAVVQTGTDVLITVEVHPWAALALGDRDLASGRAPESDREIALSEDVVDSEHLDVGDVVGVGFGEKAESLTVVGVVAADDSGTDATDTYVRDEHARLQGDAAAQRVAVVGVWPADGDDTGALKAIAARHGARLWSADGRGELEVVRQGSAKGALVSAGGAFSGLGIIVSAFTLIVITSLQVRERSRELALLRVVGATPRQVKRFLRSEIRWIAITAGTAGALVGPLVGGRLIGLLQSWDVIPRRLEPVYSPLPFLTAFAIVVISAEIAVRLSTRRVVRGSPLAGLEAADERGARSPRTRTALIGLTLGLVMACAPMYASGDAAAGLPALSGLVIAISLGPLSPRIIRMAAWTLRRQGRRSAPRYLALASLDARSARAGGALAPIVLGVSLSCTQLIAGTTQAAIASDQVEGGQRSDLLITAPRTGVADEVADEVAAISGVASVEPIVATSILIRGNQHDASWQPLPALAVEGDRVEQYADLRPVGSSTVRLAEGGVALSTQIADVLGADKGDDLEIVLPDGRAIERRVTGLYLRGLGFGDIVLPIDDLKPATASGHSTALAVTVRDGATDSDVERRIGELLADVPGVNITSSATVGESETAAGEVAFPLLLLLILWGYIAIAVVNSLVVTTLARRPEFATLRVVGTTPSQQRRISRWEAAFLAGTACVAATLATLPGLCGLTFVLSNGERIVPGIDVLTYAVVVVTSFALVLAATEAATRRAMR